MDLNEIIEQSEDYLSLLNEIKNGKLANTILLINKDSEYLLSFANALACAVINNGENIRNEHYNKVMSFSHPDVQLYPESGKLLVADSQKIVEESFIKPVFADKKIFIVSNIENSMESAQNKLLKVFEEPPKNVFFIITCSNTNLVLPTIKSRCSKHELQKINKALIEKHFANHPNCSLIASLCDGMIGKAYQLSKKKDLNEIYDFSVSLITHMLSSKDILKYSKTMLSFKDDFVLILEILSFALEDMLYIKTNNLSQVRFIDKLEQLKISSKEFSIQAICEIEKIISKAMEEKFYNVNLTLITENLLLKMLEEKYLCK